MSPMGKLALSLSDRDNAYVCSSEGNEMLCLNSVTGRGGLSVVGVYMYIWECMYEFTWHAHRTENGIVLFYDKQNLLKYIMDLKALSGGNKLLKHVVIIIITIPGFHSALSIRRCQWLVQASGRSGREPSFPEWHASIRAYINIDLPFYRTGLLRQYSKFFNLCFS